MATADQIKSLVKAYIDSDDEKFKTVVLQIAAYEAKINHTTVARELKALSEKIGKEQTKIFRLAPMSTNPLLDVQYSQSKLSDLIVPKDINDRIDRILIEFHNRHKLQSYGMTNRRKILIEGNPGTGKTFTANVIAGELNLPLYTVQMDKLVTKFMGETSVKLRQIFDSIEATTGVYFFDEFDAIGANRSLDNEVGEMRRILNSFLQFIEQDNSDSIIIAATNNQKLLDTALFRRFDDILHYSMPTHQEVETIYCHKIGAYQAGFRTGAELIKKSLALSHAEVFSVCDDAIKESILSGQEITDRKLLKFIEDRLIIYAGEEA